MGWLVGVATATLLLGTGAIVVKLLLSIRPPDRTEWEDAARELGLGYLWPVLEGKVGGFSVKLNLEAPFKASGIIDFTVDGRGSIPRDLAIKARMLLDVDGRTGDTMFDDAISVAGPETHALAVLGEEGRKAAMLLVRIGGRMENGALHLGWGGTSREMVLKTREMLELGRALSLDAATIPERLRQHAQADGSPAVRQRNLSVLLRDFPGSDDARLAVEAALHDADLGIRLFAVQHAPPEQARATLEALALDGSAPHEARLAAVEILLRSKVDLRPVVEELLGTSNAVLRAVAAHLAGATGERRFVARLLELSGGEALEVAVAALGALGELADPAAEAPLESLLQSQSLAIQCAAARALGRGGGIRAVESLRRASEGLLANGNLKDAAHDAIRRIQERLAGAEAGQVSVAPVADEAGALSVAAAGGELSVAGGRDKVR